MTVKRVGVIGAGTMGNGIAQTCTAAGLSVTMVDISKDALDRALVTIGVNLDRLVKKEKLSTQDKEAILGRITVATELSAVADVDVAIEAATENTALKLKLLRELDGLLGPDAILVTNTSSISITMLAAAVNRSEKFIGMHFFNPVPVMALVELIRGLQTSDETHQGMEALARQIGKTPITVRNNPGFAVNRILCPMINEAIFVLAEGIATAADIDEGMKLGCNHPIGPLALADMIGLDTLLAVLEVFYEGFNDSKYRPAPLLKEMVAAGYLGRKSGRGFYQY
ncbi:3-hydroxyacyl-CoA dehydrogenase (plasmid) [Aromatoleum aromaticum EbN1]|uniref:3-hydroxyacyl-CoA dehydrogenase n=1 Tax=Aromatoleum aromaticum (strain DSM 19018 / LMG 30748 / EbN1) TaxID=76114 RepID=Q5NW42_AROAE|nr:3-hydroxybutyryl-CoA dehydrogenase [Aromatoleum aromaticum]CAI10722.1 3-hydroxyacyl-CoA dehydrogenase [Aromatoleum aromaticum EbN1]